MAYTVVQLSTLDRDGDTMYRETWPMQALGSLPEFRVIDVHYLHPGRYQLAFDADLLVLGMVTEPEIIPILRWRRAKGKPTILDIQNNTFEIDPWSPTFEVCNDPTRSAILLHLIALTDFAQTTTSFLAETFAPYCSRVAVFPNQLADVMVSKRLPPRGKSPFVVGWGGSLSHILDVACVASALSKWIVEHEDAVLWIMGHEGVAELFALPPGKMRFVPWGDMEAYIEFLRGMHIGLAPMRDNPFNRSRSDVKWLEYAANGCVFVGQRISPYTDSVEDGKTGFLFRDTSELLRILDRLYADRKLMESARRAAYDRVVKSRRNEDHIHERAKAYRELLERKPPEGGEAWDLDKRVHLPRIHLPDPLPGYLPIRLEPDEEKALAKLSYDQFDVSEDRVRLVEERYGEFHLTGFCRAVMAIERRDLASAERYLRRALSFYPAAVRSLSVLGRVLLEMRRFAEARQVLSLALQWHNRYMPAYRYLLTVAERESRLPRDWEAAIAVAEEWGRHFNDDPCARMRKGLALVRSGREREGLEHISDAMNRVKDQWRFWQIPFAAELVQVLRELDGSASRGGACQDLLVMAAEMFPYGIWLGARAGAVCFQRGEYERGAKILRSARERLLEREWQGVEGGLPPEQYRGIIEIYRRACEELGQR